MARGTLALKVSSVSLTTRHWQALDSFASEYGYNGRSPALRRILELSPHLQPHLNDSEKEEPTPCPSPS